MEKRSKPNERSQALLKEIEAFQAAMRKGGFAEATRTVYLRAFDAFARRLDRKTPAAVSGNILMCSRVLFLTIPVAFDCPARRYTFNGFAWSCKPKKALAIIDHVNTFATLIISPFFYLFFLTG
jgi:hypothetical protein